jgi:hypothetical protein
MRPDNADEASPPSSFDVKNTCRFIFLPHALMPRHLLKYSGKYLYLSDMFARTKKGT